MKLNRFAAFTAGVIISTVSFGAATFVNAAGEESLKACANKTTGAMRYLSKGKCRKTERLLSWNQIGPVGPVGPVGPSGPAGSVPDVSLFALKSEVVKQTLSTVPLGVKALGVNEAVKLQPTIERATTDALVGGATQAFTSKFRIPTNYRGTITGTCPSSLPIPIAAAYLGLRLDGSRYPDGLGGTRLVPTFGGYYLSWEARADFSSSPASEEFFLYVTQVCASDTAIETAPR